MGKHTRGRVELICGSMFSGKTEELIRRLRRAKIARQQVQVFKPVIDDRYHAERVMSHNGLDFEARPVTSPEDILAAIDPATTVVAIDEVQFFGASIVDICESLAEQ
ncbi:MAG TPA: thymidine kinase, partial [Anaerolineae bacterium]